MGASRVLAMLRRVACAEACHNLSLHHTTRFCCAAALGVRVCVSIDRCENIGTFVIVRIQISTHPYTLTSTEAVLLCNSKNLYTNPYLYIYVHRGSSLTNMFFCGFANIADGRQQTTRGEQNPAGRTMCVRVLCFSLYGGESLFLS